MINSLSLSGIIIFFISSFFYTPHVMGSTSVYISEVNYNGSSVNGGDKWVELANPTDGKVVIDGWKLNMPNSSKTGTVSLSGLIEPFSTYVVGVKNSLFVSLYPNPNITNYNITNISNTQPDKLNYINIQLIDNKGTVLSKIEKGDGFVKSIGVSGKGETKYSLECDIGGICNPSFELYSTTGLDYGTPDKAIFPRINIPTEKKVEPVLVSNTIIADIAPAESNTVVSSLPKETDSILSGQNNAKEIPLVQIQPTEPVRQNVLNQVQSTSTTVSSPDLLVIGTKNIPTPSVLANTNTAIQTVTPSTKANQNIYQYFNNPTLTNTSAQAIPNIQNFHNFNNSTKSQFILLVVLSIIKLTSPKNITFFRFLMLDKIEHGL